MPPTQNLIALKQYMKRRGNIYRYPLRHGLRRATSPKVGGIGISGQPMQIKESSAFRKMPGPVAQIHRCDAVNPDRKARL